MNYREEEPQNWVFRNNKWKEKLTYTLDIIKRICHREGFNFDRYLEDRFSLKEQEKLRAGKEVYKYRELPGKISFGVKDYYYDWSF